MEMNSKNLYFSFQNLKRNRRKSRNPSNNNNNNLDRMQYAHRNTRFLTSSSSISTSNSLN